MSKKLPLIYIISFVFFLSSCSSVAPMHHHNVHKTQQFLKKEIKIAKQQLQPKKATFTLPPDVASSLMPKAQPLKLKSDQRFDIQVNAMPIQQFIAALMQNLNISFVVSPKLKQIVTLNLRNVNLSDILNTLHNLYGISYQKSTFGYKITPPELKTQIFTINYLNMSRASTSSSKLEEAAGLSGSGSSSGKSSSSGSQITSSSNTATFWLEVEAAIKQMIQNEPGSSVNISPTTGIIVVKAYPNALKAIGDYLQMTQNITDRQVIIDAKIIEIRLDKAYSTGINWDNLGFNADVSKGSYTIKTPVKLHDIKTVLNLLSSEGKVTVLSSPRVVTLNNQQALIEVGENQFFVTGVNSGTTPIGGSTATLTSNVKLEPFFSGISLSVLPQINRNGDITLFIHPSISQVTENKLPVKLSDTQSLELPLAKTNLRETDSVVRVKSGQVIVLGGLMQSRVSTNASGPPGATDAGIYPINDDKGHVQELVILLKATVPDQDTWVKQLESFQGNYSNLAKQMQVGS